MSPRRRTLCFVLILISLNNDLVFVAGLAVGPVQTEYYPSSGSPTPQLVNSLLTVTSTNRVLPEFVPVPQKGFPTQKFNEVFSFGSYPASVSINAVSTSNYAKPTTYSTYLPPLEISNSLPIVEPITEALVRPSDIESLTIIENYPPVTQTVQIEGFAPTANVPEIYQTPITVQIPSMPQLSPLITVASPLPEILSSQNIVQEIYTPNVLPELYPQKVDTEITTVTSVPLEPTTLPIPPSDFGYGNQQLPVTLQINMASPWTPEPVVAVIPQPQPAPSPCSSFDPSFGMSPGPIIVMEKSKSKWKSILPILMLSLFDGGSGNNGGGGCGCSQCSTSTPIPYPIAIPVNNPIIARGKGKNRASSG